MENLNEPPEFVADADPIAAVLGQSAFVVAGALFSEHMGRLYEWSDQDGCFGWRLMDPEIEGCIFPRRDEGGSK